MPTLSEKILGMERSLETEFETYFEQNLADVTQTPEDIANTLSRIGQETGTTPAVLWAIPRGDHLHLVLITPDGEPIVRDLYDVPNAVLLKTIRTFQKNISHANNHTYLRSAQQLHQWLLAPFEAEFLETAGVDMLLVCLGDGIRGLSMSALHDGNQFLIEKYSLTQIPAFNLIKTDYDSLQQGQVLAMGSSEFEHQTPLPAVPMELANVLWELRSARTTQAPWEGRSLLNQGFTLDNVNTLLANRGFDIVHLATHAAFKPGQPNNSYVQLWDTKLSLDQLRGLKWQDSPELLVLSACETAIGDPEAELGFAGVALQSGAKSAVASLWDVSDVGTMALMSEFYQGLTAMPTKAEALQQAQLKMLRGDVHLAANRLKLSRGEVSLPMDLDGHENLSHPFYWAGFTMISSPW
ncbi:CHAT domain-containing protein [Leptothoe spongobia TAU-MAC 1115]|uniref:CHAT domain-containing protein n=2 Tax=Leptothoe TaxID=2651725 RepID=A0A947GHY4_9CYAN|nr:CHAT domain-containing protein [Leptothoe spongobia TAU-MAC 1115]